MTIYINYHFVWVTKWNLNIIKKHTTFKQHLRNTVTELSHWKPCTRIKEHWGFSKRTVLKKFSIHLNVNQWNLQKTTWCCVTAEWGEIHADRSAQQSTTHCWSLRKPCLLFDSPDNHYNWDTCTYSDVVDSTNCRGHFQHCQNKWQLGMAESLYLLDPTLNPSFATDYLVRFWTP